MARSKRGHRNYSEVCDDEEDSIRAGDLSVVKYLGTDGYGKHIFRIKDKTVDYESDEAPVTGKARLHLPEVLVTEEGEILFLPQ